MKFVIPGGSGQIGSVLSRQFLADGHEVVIISRNPAAHGKARYVSWNSPDWQLELEGATAVINLSGRSVNCRYNAANRREILDSRISSTHRIGQGIQAAKNPPAIWMQMSTATIYAHRFDAPNDEATGVLGTVNDPVPGTWNFSTGVALSWEQAANRMRTPAQTRKILLRTTILMSPDPGGAFNVLLGLVKRGLGGTNGDGRQFVSWIHEHDFVQSIYWLISHPQMTGPVNLAAPNPLPNREFMGALRAAAGVRLGLPATRVMLEIGAVFLRTETELILKSRRVIPGKLLESGFRFQFPEWPAAARDLCNRNRV